jgi:hypothetical protein
MSDQCECDWRWHEGAPCPVPTTIDPPLRISPSLCTQCLLVCEGERDDEAGTNDPDWNDCGSGRCDANTGCPECSDEDRTWVRRS